MGLLRISSVWSVPPNVINYLLNKNCCVCSYITIQLRIIMFLHDVEGPALLVLPDHHILAPLFHKN